MSIKFKAPELLIVNADDYGYSEPVNAAILELLTLKRISSTTVLATMASEDALSAIKHFTGQIGIHLNLIEGKPLSHPDAVSSLVSKDGFFVGTKELLKRSILKKIKAPEIHIEILAQLHRLSDHGIAITHADSHQHVHVLPAIAPIVLNSLTSAGIKKVRFPYPTETGSVRMKMLRYFSLLAKHHFDEFQSPKILATSFSTLGPEYFRTLKELERVKTTSEWMCHPSLLNDHSYLNKRAEYDFLKSEDWIFLLQYCNVQLISYDRL